MSILTKEQQIALRWMTEVANMGGRGLYGPSLHRGVEFPECEDLVARGFARRTSDGYWASPAGRTALTRAELEGLEDGPAKT